jgi:hypothetical protein
MNRTSLVARFVLITSTAVALCVLVLSRSGHSLGESQLARITGTNPGVSKVNASYVCATQNLAGGQVAGPRCFGPQGNPCVICDPGTGPDALSGGSYPGFDTANLYDPGGANQSCAGLTKKVGTCELDEDDEYVCVGATGTAACAGTYRIYNYQLARRDERGLDPLVLAANRTVVNPYCHSHAHR